MNSLVNSIRQKLQQQFSPSHLEVIDESDKHIGHTGAREGKGHFNIIISSGAFQNKTLVEQHRMIYDALNELMKTDIHALRIKINP